MGAPMVRRLAGAGHRVLIRDISREAESALESLDGVSLTGSPREMADGSDFVLLSLPSPEALLDVVDGAEGLTASGNTPVVIDLSTSGTRASRKAAAILSGRGQGFLDAPVSGGVPGAEKGTLSIMAAGASDVYEQSKPVLEILGRNIFYIGEEPGQGQAMKLVNNLLSGAALALTAEAMAVATKAGIDPDVALSVLNVSTGKNAATETKFLEDVVTGSFSYGFTTGLIYKDVKLFEDLAEELGVTTLISPAAINAWRIAMINGYEKHSFTSIAKMYEGWAGVEIRSRKKA